MSYRGQFKGGVKDPFTYQMVDLEAVSVPLMYQRASSYQS